MMTVWSVDELDMQNGRVEHVDQHEDIQHEDVPVAHMSDKHTILDNSNRKKASKRKRY